MAGATQAQTPPREHTLQTGAAAEMFNPRDYGAIGDGKPHPSGLTLAQLAAKYPWIASYPFGTLFNLPTAAVSAAGSNKLSFRVTQPTNNAATLSGSYALSLADVGGISHGMNVGGPGIAPQTQVEWVNPATLQIGLSAATTAAIPPGSVLAFAHSWLSHVTVGMQVSGPGAPAGATVVSVGDGVVTLSAPLTTGTLAPTRNTAAAPAYEGTAITFYAPFTDAQAAALQIDGLGIQAAVAAAAPGGGTVRLPAGGPWLTSEPLVLPTATGSSILGVSLVGDGSTVTTIAAQGDLGPSSYAVSCGDPTATEANARGMYLGGGKACDGELRDLNVSLDNARIVHLGARPQIGSVSVAMGGVKQGPRENMRRVRVGGFNVGVQFQGDWTTWDYVTLANNFIGLRLDDPMSNLFGDLSFHQVFFGANSFAGIAVSPRASLIAIHMDKSWVADQPYDIWLEPGLPTPGYGIDLSVFDVVNFEGPGCAVIKDGNITNADAVVGAGRHLQTVTMRQPFVGENNPAYALASGCPWRGFINVNSAAGVRIEGIGGGANFAPAAGSTAPMLNVHLTTPYTVEDAGGFSLSGDGLKTLIEQYAGACAELVSSGASPDFRNARADLAIEMEILGVGRFHEFDFEDGAAGGAIAKGTLLEQANFFGFRAAQRAGVAPANTATLLGAVAGAYPCNPTGKWVTAAVEGQSMPVAVSKAQAGLTLLQTDTAHPGKATSTPNLLTGRQLGFVTDPNGASNSLVFMQGSFLHPGP